MTSVMKAWVHRASETDCGVVGLRLGWEALTHVNLDDAASRNRYIQPLNRDNTRIIDRTGGTYLHSTRTNPSKVKKLPPHLAGKQFPKSGAGAYDLSSQVLGNLQALRLDYLIALRRAHTLSYAATLAKLAVQLICIPKTMDNAVRNTEYCIGFSTATSPA